MLSLLTTEVMLRIALYKLLNNNNLYTVHKFAALLDQNYLHVVNCLC